jgi:hypothetical protein
MDIDGRFIDANASALNEKLLEFPLNQLICCGQRGVSEKNSDST